MEAIRRSGHSPLRIHSPVAADGRSQKGLYASLHSITWRHVASRRSGCTHMDMNQKGTLEDAEQDVRGWRCKVGKSRCRRHRWRDPDTLFLFFYGPAVQRLLMPTGLPSPRELAGHGIAWAWHGTALHGTAWRGHGMACHVSYDVCIRSHRGKRRRARCLCSRLCASWNGPRGEFVSTTVCRFVRVTDGTSFGVTACPTLTRPPGQGHA